MLRYLSIFIILFSVSIVGAQTSYTISGYILDQKTNVQLSTVHVKVNGKIKGVISDSKGFYSITLNKAPVELIFSHMSYENKKLSIAKAENKRIDITLKEQVYELDVADVNAKKTPINLVAKKLYDVWDYEFMGDNLLLFAYRYKEEINPWLVLINTRGDTICTQHIDVEGTFYKDCVDNIHLITKDKAYQIFYDSTGMQLLYPVSPKEFKEALSPCIAEMNNMFYLKQYYFNNQVLTYYMGNQNDTTVKEFRVIADQVGLNMLAGRDQFHAMGDAPTEADLRFEEMCFFDPIFAPLVKVKDQICIFNYIDSQIEFYDSDGEFIKSVAISFHKQQYWKEEIYVDSRAGKVYTLFKKNGKSTLHQINLKTGLLGKSTIIPTYIFVDKIKVNNNNIYFLYRKNTLNDLMKLFKYAIN